MNSTPDTNGFGEYRRLLLAELERLDKGIESLAARVDAGDKDIRAALDEKVADVLVQIKNIEIQVATLNVKSGVWGAMGGAIPVAIGLLVWLLTR